MKKIISILLSILCIACIFCGCGGDTSKQDEIEKTSTISEENNAQNNELTDDEKTETKDEKISVEDIKNQLAITLESLGDTSGFTNEKTETSNGSTTHSFSFFLEKVSVSIVETDAGIQQISCLALPSTFTMTGFSDDEALNLAAKLCVTPLVTLSQDSSVDSLYQNIVSATREIENDSVTYTYEKDGWSYILVGSYSMVTVAVKPVV